MTELGIKIEELKEKRARRKEAQELEWKQHPLSGRIDSLEPGEIVSFEEIQPYIGVVIKSKAQVLRWLWSVIPRSKHRHHTRLLVVVDDGVRLTDGSHVVKCDICGETFTTWTNAKRHSWMDRDHDCYEVAKRAARAASKRRNRDRKRKALEGGRA